MILNCYFFVSKMESFMIRVILFSGILLIFHSELSAQSRVDSLSWLSGQWGDKDSTSSYLEIWMTPEGNSMIGMSRTVSDNKTVAYEFMRIVAEENGNIFYIAHPSGQEETFFKLIDLNSSKVIFENQEHDFPQRIIYHFKSDSLITARIEGEINGEKRSSDFLMKRIEN
jgi:hypothetical protein